MNVNRQTARSAATRAKLVKAARALFARHGFTGVGTEEIVRRAGVTRGALYHQFPTKEELFLAVYEQVEQELTAGVLAGLDESEGPLAALRAGVRGFLEACRAPEVQRIVLLDGPAVLGFERWRAVAERYGLGLMQTVIAAAVQEGEIDRVEVEPLAHMLMGALDAAALLIARDPDGGDAVAATLERVIDGLHATRSKRR